MSTRRRCARARAHLRRTLYRLVRGLMVAGAAIGPAPPPPPPPAPPETEQVDEAAAEDAED